MIHDLHNCKMCREAMMKGADRVVIYKMVGLGARLQSSICEKCFNKRKKDLDEDGWVVDHGLMQAFER